MSFRAVTASKISLQVSSRLGNTSKVTVSAPGKVEFPEYVEYMSLSWENKIRAGSLNGTTSSQQDTTGSIMRNRLSSMKE